MLKLETRKNKDIILIKNTKIRTLNPLTSEKVIGSILSRRIRYKQIKIINMNAKQCVNTFVPDISMGIFACME